MDKLAYHYDKIKLPAKTEGKYLYYYPCEDTESATVDFIDSIYSIIISECNNSIKKSTFILASFFSLIIAKA